MLIGSVSQRIQKGFDALRELRSGKHHPKLIADAEKVVKGDPMSNYGSGGDKGRLFYITELGIQALEQYERENGPLQLVSMLRRQRSDRDLSKDRLAVETSSGIEHDESANDARLPEEVSEADDLFEGAMRRIIVNAYERNPKARAQCIEEYGVCCCICGFNFGTTYGKDGEGYIHVHHLKALSEIGEEYKVDPIEDLRPVCPNCHAMLHRGGVCRNIEEVKEMISNAFRRR